MAVEKFSLKTNQTLSLRLMKSLINSYPWFQSFLAVSNLGRYKVILRFMMSRGGHLLLINTCHDLMYYQTLPSMRKLILKEIIKWTIMPAFGNHCWLSRICIKRYQRMVLESSLFVLRFLEGKKLVMTHIIYISQITIFIK